MSDSMQPHRLQPTRLPRPWDSPGKNTGVGCQVCLQHMWMKWKWKVKVKSLSHVRLLAIPWTAAYQAPLSMGFSRQECWSGCHRLLRLVHHWCTKVNAVSLLKSSSVFGSKKKTKYLFLIKQATTIGSFYRNECKNVHIIIIISLLFLWETSNNLSQ